MTKASGIARIGLPSSAFLSDTGICLAKAHLYGTLDPIILPSLPVLNSVTPTALYTSPSVPNQQGLFAVFEFSIQDAFNVSLRTVVRLAGATDWGNFWTAPVGFDSHVRGWWPFSTVYVESAASIDGCATGGTDQFAIGDPNGADSRAFAKQAIDTHGSPKGNNGLYGANMHYQFQVYNKCHDVDGQGLCWLLARNTGGGFFGAAMVEDFGAASKLGVPPIRTGTLQNCAELNEGGPVVIPHDTWPPVNKGFWVAVGGAATLPVNFVGSNAWI